MSACILDGSRYAAEILDHVQAEVRNLTALGSPPRLVSILVGSDDAGRLYAGSQRKRCQQAGIEYGLVELPASATQTDLFAEIQRLNADPRVTGVMLHLPLPPGIDSAAAQYQIDPYKDVEGVNPANIGLLFYGVPIIAPCTALAVNEMIRRSEVQVRGAHAVVVGQSRIVGKPVTMFLTTQEATVTACHKETRDLPSHTQAADILIVAVGKPGIIRAEHVKPGAVVIDVGISTITVSDGRGGEVRRTVGDVDFEAVREVAGWLTPVPGGVGPLTVAMLLRNTVEAVRKQRDRHLAQVQR